MADPQARPPRPPLSRPLRVVLLAAALIFFGVMALGLADAPGWTLGAWGIAWTAVILAAAFVMLRDGFSAREKQRRAAKRKPPSPPKSADHP